MLLFRSEENIDGWCARHQLSRGQLLTLQQVWSLSRLWYRGRMSPDYQGRTAQQAEAIFRQAGLTGPFWSFS